MKNNNLLIIIIVAVVVGIVAFFAGTKYRVSQFAAGNFQNGAFRQRGMMGQGQNFRPVRGDIIGRDDKSITVKLSDGSSKIILFSDKTVYLKSSTGSKDDLKTGDKVMVIGTENSDGSVTAQDVQINPPAIGNFNRAQ
ncbi:MAG: hypothetical protein A3H79_02640 [Candidatus Levybacteria bacterium RIFCSPLOWO2_02_FULL_36_8b]|nr:MAG: hypothetical protein A3H79_02640 [Candidatus Levybacteria bacterium RIFCSPLOWO2_02_FULL_36_8b]